MNIKVSLISASLIIALNISAVSLNEDIQIKSDTVEFLKEANQISFINNVEINSNFVTISAKSALYDDIGKIISIKGMPSLIESNKDDSSFSGTAEKIIFLVMKKFI